MEKVTQRDTILGIVKRWEDQYSSYLGDGVNDKNKILAKLKALDLETATPEQIATIIGNDSWTRLSCDECGKEVTTVIVLGEEPDYESSTASLCHECLATAMQLSGWVAVEGSGSFIYPRPPESDEKDNHWGTILIDGNEVTFTPSCTVAHKEE
jgi:hypothetical protein